MQNLVSTAATSAVLVGQGVKTSSTNMDALQYQLETKVVQHVRKAKQAQKAVLKKLKQKKVASIDEFLVTQSM